jgi:hypothetical protein
MGAADRDPSLPQDIHSQESDQAAQKLEQASVVTEGLLVTEDLHG